MSRNLSGLFVEETVKSEQSRLFHLIRVELDDLFVTGTSNADLSQILIQDVSDILIGQTINIAGVGDRKVVDIQGSVVQLDAPTSISVTNAVVRFTLLFAMVDSNYDITYDGMTYLRFPVQFSETSISSDGSIDKAKLSVGNVSREVMYYVEKYDGMRNRRVYIKTVFEKFLDKKYAVASDGTVTVTDNPGKDATACVTDEYIIDTYSADENVVQFQLDPCIDLEIKIPRRRYLPDTCGWMFKGVECGYSGALNTCPKTLQGCRDRGNAARFGGSPGISGNGRRIWL